MTSHILVVDDEAHIQDVICFALERAGMTTMTAGNGAQALKLVQRDHIDLVVLDIGMPEMDGLEFCRRIRANSELPILFLSARDEEIDRVLGLEIGGDDYVTKPFSPRELVARVKTILKRTSAQYKTEHTSRVQHGAILLDRQQHSAKYNGNDIQLTSSEFDLLFTILTRPQLVLTRPQLINAIHGHGKHISERTIDSHVRNIRSKFKKIDAGEIISTVHGVGFKCTPIQ